VRGAIQARPPWFRTQGPAPGNFNHSTQEHIMNSIVYIVGLVVIVLAALSFFGLR
jgi:hypothetical protein